MKKSIICYYSKHNAAKQLAEQLANQLQLPICKASELKTPHDYDQLIIVCAIYVGKMHQSVTTLIEQAKDTSIIFVKVGLQQGDIDKCLQENVNAHSTNIKKAFDVGGVINMSELTIFERGIMRMINREMHFATQLKKDEVYTFIKADVVQEVIAAVQKDI